MSKVQKILRLKYVQPIRSQAQLNILHLSSPAIFGWHHRRTTHGYDYKAGVNVYCSTAAGIQTIQKLYNWMEDHTMELNYLMYILAS